VLEERLLELDRDRLPVADGGHFDQAQPVRGSRAYA
jgi:hypothetical protein